MIQPIVSSNGTYVEIIHFSLTKIFELLILFRNDEHGIIAQHCRNLNSATYKSVCLLKKQYDINLKFLIISSLVLLHMNY